MALTLCKDCVYAHNGECTRHAPLWHDEIHYPHRKSIQPELPDSGQCGDGEAKPVQPKVCKHCGKEIRISASGHWHVEFQGVPSAFCDAHISNLHEPKED